MLSVLFVCHGNICRSTMAESMFAHMLTERGLSSAIRVSSAATHRDALGEPPHYGTVQKLREEKIPLVPHTARLLTREDGERYDFIIGMDAENLRHMLRILGAAYADKVSLLLDYTSRPRAIADPWYTGNFDETFCDLEEGLSAFLEFLIRSGRLEGGKP